jgi:hypothetical protein
VFVSKKHLRLKLQRSIADANKRVVEVGGGGWIELDLDDRPAEPILKAWITGSHSIFSGASRASTTAAKSKSPRKSKR